MACACNCLEETPACKLPSDGFSISWVGERKMEAFMENTRARFVRARVNHFLVMPPRLRACR